MNIPARSRKRFKTSLLTLGLASLACLVVFALIKFSPYDVDAAASRAERHLGKMMVELDRYIALTTVTDEKELLRFDSFPKDFVIYRYVNDSLQSWCNQFSEINDDIAEKLIFARLTSTPNRLNSPLERVGNKAMYLNLGPKWYVVKMVQPNPEVKIIAGIEIKNTLIEKHTSGSNGLNHRFRLKSKFDILPLTEDVGACVNVEGEPVFKVIRNRDWGMRLQFSRRLFSPIVYADGPVFSSLGALISINLALIIVMTVLLLVRRKILWKIYEKEDSARLKLIIYGISIIVLMVASFTYAHISLKSLSDNSDISLEFFRWSGKGWYSAVVFVSYIVLMVLTWFQAYCLKPVIKEFTNLNFNPLGVGWLIAFAFITAAFLTATSNRNGYKKEQYRVWTWADRLAIDRNISLELQLISIEDAIASDQVISTLINFENSDRIILNRISDNFLNRLSQVHDVSILVNPESDQRGNYLLESIVRNGVQIADGSRFFYLDSSDGNSGYFGIFTYFNKTKGITRLILQMPNNPSNDRYGYRSLLRPGVRPGELNLPSYYSYAKYFDYKLKNSHSGFTAYPYPTVFRPIGDGFDENGHSIVDANGFKHFFSRINDEEIIVISRPARRFTVYFTSFSFIFLSLFMASLLFRKDPRQVKKAKRNQLKTKVNLLIICALVLTLASIVIVSVAFVYNRNETNLKSLMTSKINTMQALLEKRCQYAESYTDLMTTDFNSDLLEVGGITRTDISLFTPGGEVFVTTAPEVFENMIVGSRLDQDAFYSITRLNQRYFIHREKFAGRKYFSLYAPIFNSNGKMIAIACCPYTDRNFDFGQEAILHASLITCLFFMLLLMSIYISSFVTDNILSNLTKLGRKMDQVDIHNLQKINYKGTDEISGLVEAYNKMVDVLGESSKQLAKAERDNAWSEMARQAAHEIKNSLTPIKLKIQKMIRLKKSGSEKWDDQFEENAKVILEHIDILAETASGFSAIAKLSTEEPTLVNLDKMLHEQTLIFDNRENISITYIGLENSYVLAPQSQLVRVFINLITNAIQAIELRQKGAGSEKGRDGNQDGTGQGKDEEKGRVVICLRKSVKDACYDVVVDDNGTGVKEEDVEKLFTPNFTTKTSGTGLGLSICRSIIESCDGNIVYSRSYALGGACFTVTLPAVENKLNA